jgi:hypothetical protein
MLQGLFVYARLRPAPMISLAAARTRLPAQHSSPGQPKQKSAVQSAGASACTIQHNPCSSCAQYWLDEGKGDDRAVVSPCRVSRVVTL